MKPLGYEEIIREGGEGDHGLNDPMMGFEDQEYKELDSLQLFHDGRQITFFQREDQEDDMGLW